MASNLRFPHKILRAVTDLFCNMMKPEDIRQP